ncbi:MAG TPA: hypothetical protein PLD27_08910 [bacterium]|nr:hypothetical protein [bacterium]HOL47948.1 hypothetical protein [bacterium]HPQ19305.1 hypothetical protein [bacterium]
MQKIYIIVTIIIFFCGTSLFSETAKSDIKIVKETEEIRFLDTQRSGIVLLPTGYRGEPATTGFNFDLIITPIVGELIGKRKNDPNKNIIWTNAGFAQLITGDLKYTFFSEQYKRPALSTGFLYTFALSWSSEEKIERPSTFSGFYLSTSKSYLRSKNGRLHFGLLTNGYAKGFSYLTDYYLPNSGFLVFLGTDIDFTKKWGLFLELAKPISDKQNSILMNFRIKGSLPLLTASLINTNDGLSLIVFMNLRLTLFPPLTKEGKDKIRKEKEMIEKSKEWDKRLKELEL